MEAPTIALIFGTTMWHACTSFKDIKHLERPKEPSCITITIIGLCVSKEL